MSFSLKLQSNASEPNRIDKDLTLVATVNGTLKTSTSIINPSFIIGVSGNVIPTFNYISCDAFGRSYFVKDVVNVGGGLWEVRCEVDVLTSFAAEIRANTAIVKRQEEKWNLLYNDGSFRCYQDPYIIMKEFPFGFNPDNSNFIVAVAGGIVETSDS